MNEGVKQSVTCRLCHAQTPRVYYTCRQACPKLLRALLSKTKGKKK